MRHKIAALALILALMVGGDDYTGYEEEAQAETAFSFSLFYNSLSPYGNWVPISGYGYGWYPAQAGYGWQPYTDGQWVWSDQGWTWVSYEPWGWATYHYGRWIYDSYYGWTWIPGTVWAPAWVSWYQAPGYIGWSPLPPDNNFFIEIGIGFSNYGYGYGPYYGGYYGGGYYDGYYGGGGHHGKKHHHKHDKGHYYDNDYYAPGEHCVFVPEDKFSNQNAKLVRVEGDRNLTVMRNVKNVTNIKAENNRIYNYGPDKSAVEKATGAKLKPVNIVDSDMSTIRTGRNGNSIEKDSYRVFRPEIQRQADETPFTGQNNVIERARNAQDSNGKGINSSLTASEKSNANLIQDRGAGSANSKSYGNTTPDGYGIRTKNTDRSPAPSAADYGKRGDNTAGRLTPGNNRSNPGANSAATVTNRQTNPYQGQAVYNSPNRAKSNTVVNDRLKNNRTIAPAPQQQRTVNRSPYANNRGTVPGTVNTYRNPGNAQTYKAPAVQPRSNYSANGYKAQQQAPKYNYQPGQGQRQTNASSTKKTTGSSGRSYSQPPARYTGPSMNTGVRSYNPGSTRSFGGNSYVQKR